MPIHHVIFDCDGVLVDSEGLANEVMMAVLAEHGLTFSHAEADALFRGRTLPVCMRVVEQLLGRPVGDELLAEVERRSHVAFDRDLRAIDGVREVLEWLPLAASVASNSSRHGLARKLRQTGLHHYFGGRLYTYEDVERPKPHPDMFLLAARRAGVDAAACVVIEDSTTGVAAARAAGMDVLGYAPVDEEPLRAAGARTFSSMAALPALIEAMMRG